MFAVIMHKGGGIGCEILCKKSKNAGYPPNILVKIDFYSRKSKFKIFLSKILALDFFQFLVYTKSRNFKNRSRVNGKS